MLRLSTFPSNVLSTVLTGFSTAVNTVVLATDSILIAIGKLQSQIDYTFTVSGNITAIGTNQATAALITNKFSNITATTAGSNHGVVLPGVVGSSFCIWNNSAHTVFVYPALGAQINAIIVNGGYSLANGTMIEFVVMSSTLVLTK